MPSNGAAFFVCLLVFLKKLSSPGLFCEEGEAGAPHLQPPELTPAVASGRAVPCKPAYVSTPQLLGVARWEGPGEPHELPVLLP